MDDKGKKDIPFTGKWMTEEPAAIGMNFRSLQNMRYTDTHVKSVQGMTKINTAVMDATYLKTRSAFHFKKSQPSESHVLVQAYNAGLTASQVLENKTAIPSAGAFEATELHTDAAGAGRGRFSDAPDGQVMYCNGVEVCMWGGNESKVGAFITSTAAVSAAGFATDPIDYTEAVNNTKQDAGNIVPIGGGVTEPLVWLVGSPRPLKGLKYYILTANTSASTMTGSQWNGSSWAALTITDNTDTGASLAVTGTVTFATTVGTAKPRYMEGYYLYWYQFAIDAGAADIYHVTLDMPFQDVVDMWDGVYRDVTRFYYNNATTRSDKTTKVLKEDYEILAVETWFDGGGLTSSEWLEIGFTEKQTGIYFSLPAEEGNITTCTASVDFWDGEAYSTVGDINDGTLEGGKSLAKTGVISWNNASIDDEQKRQLNNSIPLYYYRVQFTDTLSGAHIDYVAGITASKKMSHFKFPVFAQGRVLLCCDMAGEKNKAVVSSKYMPQVYNGADSVDVYFGDEGELTCGTELFSQFGSSLYSLVLMHKNHETWVMAGQDIDAWADNTFLLSSTIGCADPLTLKTINLHAEPGAGVNRALAIWRGPDGVYMSDGRAPIPIHGDIKDYFDPESTLYIASDGTADAFIDPVKQEYHLLLNATTEVVYDIARNKWFEIPRGTALQCGVTVHDTAGNAYCYGFIDTGYMERLEYGTTFDGTSIVPVVQFGDIPLGGLDVETRISDVTLFTKAQTTDVECTHYGDTSSSGTAKNMDHTSTNRLAMPDFDEKLNGYFHSLKYSTTGAFEPLATTIWYHEI